MTSKVIFDKLVTLLEKAKVQCNIKYDDSEYTVELGMDYPEKIANKVGKVFAKLKFDNSDSVSICAWSSGGKIIDSRRLNGGPQEYYRGKSIGSARY